MVAHSAFVDRALIGAGGVAFLVLDPPGAEHLGASAELERASAVEQRARHDYLVELLPVVAEPVAALAEVGGWVAVPGEVV